MNHKKWPDWNCPECSYYNFGSRSECSECGCFRSKAFNNDNNNSKKKGDWTCNCGELNFASRTECRKCKKIKSCFVTGIKVVSEKEADPLVPSIEVKPGDWLCPKCSINNFGSRVVCFKCSTPRVVEQQKNSAQINEKSAPIDEKDECVVCLERKKDTVITVCGHLGYCNACALNMKSCPICRATYNPQKDLLKVFII